MRNKRTRYLRQRSYVIAAIIMLVAAFGMTGVYFSQQAKDKKVKQQELAAKEEQKKQEQKRKEELAKKEKETKTEEVARIIPPKNDDFLDSPNDIANGYFRESMEFDRAVNNINNAAKNEEESKIEEDAEETEEPEEVEVSASAVLPELNFSADTDLNWPLQGNVILNYSMDQTVYFATLDQYKYNPAIIIKGEVNDKVLSVAKGKIESIVTDEVTGHTVTIDLGNGFQAVYGQLKEIPFTEGQYINEGDIIGYVSEPTKYFSVEGSNVYFQLLKDGEPTNPMEYLN